MLAQRQWDAVSLEGVVRFIEDERTDFTGGGSEAVPLPWDLTAADYLGFSRTDLRQRGLRSRVNALGNAKRAMHCQVDSVLYSAGFWSQVQSRGWDFPSKTDLLAELKIVAPGVLGRLNTLRNRVEHAYSAPADPQAVEDYIDVVEMFVAHAEPFATRRYELSEYSRTYRGRDRSVGVRNRAGALEVRIYGATRPRLLRPRSYREFRRLQIAVYTANRRAAEYP